MFSRMTSRATIVAIGVVALLIWGGMTSGFARSYCGRCADQRTTFDVFRLPVVVIEPHYDEYDIVALWESAHGRPCENLWNPGPFNERRLDVRFFPPMHFAAATVRRRDEAEAIMLRSSPESLNQQDTLGRTPMHWLASASGIGALGDQLRSRGVRLDIRDEDGLTPLDWDWRARQEPAS